MRIKEEKMMLLERIKDHAPREKAIAILGTVSSYCIKRNPGSCQALLDIAKYFFKQAGEEPPAEVHELQKQIDTVEVARDIKYLERLSRYKH